MIFISSQAFFQKLGFVLIDDFFLPDPSSDYEKRDFKLAKEELTMITFELSE